MRPPRGNADRVADQLAVIRLERFMRLGLSGHASFSVFAQHVREGHERLRQRLGHEVYR